MQSGIMSIFVLVILVLTTVAIIAGFFLIGSPFLERQRQFDQQRINDLTSIQWQIINYWQSKAVLPESIVQLKNDISGYMPPVDPESKVSYFYKSTGKLTFQLCATFVTASDASTIQVTILLRIYNSEYLLLIF